MTDLEWQSLASSNPNSAEPELEEIVAPTIASFSFALPVILLVIFLIFHIDLNQLRKPDPTRQIVEIELVAPSDAIDRKEFLPSSDKEIANKARKGALYTVATPVLTGAPIPRSNLPSQPDNIEAFKAPDNRKTVIVAKGKDNSIAFSAYSKIMATKSNSPQNSHAFLSEVEPANMIELIDNDGKPTLLTIQSGGRSSNGNGASSNLHEYLRLLNQKVRNNWIPPRGIDRIAVIEFRISKAGRLISTKAMPRGAAPNADREAEAAAIVALNKTFPFLPLPEEIRTSYLDVRYTFNYRFNQIGEVSSEQ
jgi:hypothetical protein